MGRKSGAKKLASNILGITNLYFETCRLACQKNPISKYETLFMIRGKRQGQIEPDLVQEDFSAIPNLGACLPTTLIPTKFIS